MIGKALDEGWSRSILHKKTSNLDFCFLTNDDRSTTASCSNARQQEDSLVFCTCGLLDTHLKNLLYTFLYCWRESSPPNSPSWNSDHSPPRAAPPSDSESQTGLLFDCNRLLTHLPSDISAAGNTGEGTSMTQHKRNPSRHKNIQQSNDR